MKFKKVIAIILCTVVFLSGCSSFSSIQKDKVMVEKEDNVEDNTKITKEKATEIASDYLEKCYNINANLEKIKPEIYFSKKRKSMPNGGWRITWTNKNKEGKEVYGYYGALVDADDGKILELIDYRNDSSLKEAKKMAFDFIKENQLISDNNNLKLLNFNEVEFNIVNFEFLYGEDENIRVDIDKSKNKVIRFIRTKAEGYKIDDRHVKIKKEKAKQIAHDGIEKYFDMKMDIKNLTEDIALIKGEKLSDKTVAPPTWSISWRDLNAKEENKNIIYGALIDANTGELREVVASNRDLNKKTNKISPEEMEKIALSFIGKSKYISNINDLGSASIKTWDNDGKESGMIEFKYKDEMLSVYIDFTDKKVYCIGFGLRGDRSE